MKKKNQKRAFTLVELLVVISIIAILAGLAFPALSGVLERGRQTKDISNIRQLGTIMLTYATDNNFKYPREGTLDANYQELTQGGYLDNADMLISVEDSKDPSTDLENVTGANISWAMADAADTGSHDSLPLLSSANSAASTITSSTTAETDETPITLEADGPWEQKGIVVFRKGNNAEFLKAKTTGVVEKWLPIGYKDSQTYQLLQPPTTGGTP